MFDESGDVINRIVFLNEFLGVLEVPPQTLLKIGEDALEIVIGNEVGEKHKEEEKKFDWHNDSPALPAAALFADLFCLIGQSAIMHAADTVKIVGVDFYLFILEDMLPPKTLTVSTIKMMFLHEHIVRFFAVIKTMSAPLFIDGFLFRGGFRDGALIGTEGIKIFNIIGCIAGCSGRTEQTSDTEN
jgi:hypothetical protein|nr:MAG TPA: hypothetical protein [Caudoviricetes sp.]